MLRQWFLGGLGAVRTGSLAMAVLLAGLCGLTQAASLTPEFVKVEGGHFVVGTQRLRLWGYNLQAGVYPSYKALDALADRLGQLGVNGVRLWPTQGTFYELSATQGPRWRQSEPGDGSALDRFDYLTAQLAKRRIYMMSPVLHHFDEAAVRHQADPRIREIVAAAKTTDALRDLHAIAPYLSLNYRAMVLANATNFLKHRNPYTGRSYASEPWIAGWELANESKFVSCLLAQACAQALPAELRKELAAEWRTQQADGAPLETVWAGLAGDAATARYRALVMNIFVSRSREMERALRLIGPGIAVQPITYSTHSGVPSALAHAAHAAGDFVACGAYGVPLGDEAAPYGPFRPFLTDAPVFWNFNYCKVKGKPTVAYETSFFRPYPFRVDWAASTAALAIAQDWDAVFLYMYGQPKFIYDGIDGRGYGKRALPMPDPHAATPGQTQYTLGFHHAGDRTVVAAWQAAGQAFLHGGIGRTPAVNTVRISRQALTASSQGYCTGASCAARDAQAGTAQLNCLSLQGRLELEFLDDAQGAGSAAWPGCTRSPGAQLWPAAGAVWDPPAAQWRVDTPEMAAVFGHLNKPISFRTGLRFEPKISGFGCAAVWSTDGKPLDSSRSLRMLACAEVSNTGFQFDPTKIDRTRPYGAQFGVQAGGRAPQLVTAAAIKLAWSRQGAWQCRTLDFDLSPSNYQPCPQVIDFADPNTYLIEAHRNDFFK